MNQSTNQPITQSTYPYSHPSVHPSENDLIHRKPDTSRHDHEPGDSTFSSEMLCVVKAAQATIIRRIAGVEPEAHHAPRKNNRAIFPGGHDNNNAFDDGRHDLAAGGRRALEGGSEDMTSSEGNYGEGSDGLGGSGGWGRDACEELLLRQEARIEELERIAVFGGDEAIVSPTLTI